MVNFSEIGDEPDYFPYLEYLGVSDGIQKEKGFRAKVKEQSAKRFPRQNGIKTSNSFRSSAPPQVVQSFEGQRSSVGVPMDNHVAVSNGNKVVSVANFNIAIYDDGQFESVRSLISFTRSLSLGGFRFDPRVIYDPQQDRFIIVMLNGTERDHTNVIVAFSQTNDPGGDWNLYIIDGNPFDQTIFSDYPMLSLTEDHLYLTLNAVDDELSWQEGFVETYIWEIDKFEGFAGDSLKPNLITGIEFGGKPLRNLCPVTKGDQNLLTDQYFLSNRNFDIQNDTFFLVHLAEGNLSVQHMISDINYGVPPNAQQRNTFLQTNDARVLDAFVQDDHIQLVCNTIDTTTGLAVIFHGLIENVNSGANITGTIISDGANEFGYPDISYAGVISDDKVSLIVMSHVSKANNRFPGVSALSYDGAEFSEILSLHEGTSDVTRINGQVQRWGDYAGNQRIYNQPGVSWVNSSFGTTGGTYGVWMAQIARPDIQVHTTNARDNDEIQLWPNPAHRFIEVTFTPPTSDMVNLMIMDMGGQKVTDISSFAPKKDGEVRFGFDIQGINSGSYLLIGSQNGEVIFSQKFIRQ